ncbi:uncharacterized protein LOC131848944 [Achroia grisella]|uniref:uncharacterized protein LOC131848944 n=1 Tax=Achroia grisella TaxID=688607 RepID=UPI0027D31900|nr:uncharacterized protein LOC131848944 [Achroia grisella]
MVKICCVRGCKIESASNCGVWFHKIPKNEKIRAKWCEALGEPITSRSAVICNQHLEVFKPKILATLKNDTVPSGLPITSESCKTKSHLPSHSDDADEIEEYSQCNLSGSFKEKKLHHIGIQASLTSPNEKMMQQKIKILQQSLRHRDKELVELRKKLHIIKNKCLTYEEVKLVMKNDFNDIHDYFVSSGRVLCD